mmetsp:Transcript_52748/g.122757  ORF Transcript_52748/g.122757 Transcript_52748/m.122757 type:complete len:226 (-) Transcript_52748:206-883(-)
MEHCPLHRLFETHLLPAAAGPAQERFYDAALAAQGQGDPGQVQGRPGHPAAAPGPALLIHGCEPSRWLSATPPAAPALLEFVRSLAPALRGEVPPLRRVLALGAFLGEAQPQLPTEAGLALGVQGRPACHGLARLPLLPHLPGSSRWLHSGFTEADSAEAARRRREQPAADASAALDLSLLYWHALFGTAPGRLRLLLHKHVALPCADVLCEVQLAQGDPRLRGV